MKKFNPKWAALIATLFAGTSIALAVPAKPVPMPYTQPDGTVVTVQLRGDERHHYYLTEDNYLLMERDGALYYGNIDANHSLVASSMLARPVADRTAAEQSYLQGVDMTSVFKALEVDAQKAVERRTRNAAAPAHKPRLNEEGTLPQSGLGLFAGTSYPAKGEQKALVVIVEYTDVKFTLDDPHDYFYRLLNEPGFADYNGTGSCRDFFIDNSGGQFVPQFDLFGPLTLDHNQAYYGGNDWFGNDKNAHEMVIEACQQLDDEVDFTEYDRDGDGYIDNVFVFYAGRGEASGGSANTVWPHSWDIMDATSVPYYFDGVRLNRYACSNEWESNRPDGIGTFVHEFSHVMGLPDLYATSYTGAFTPGSWSALDYGPYNNNACTPPCFGAFERNALGWMTPEVIDGSAVLTLDKIGTNKAYIIPTAKTNEFFLLENRQQEGWDTYIPGHGMLVWHIDYNESVWNSNTVNNSASHQYVDIEEADGSASEWTRAGDAFPGSAGITEFTDDTRPSMRTWNGAALELPITDICEVDGIIHFNVAGGRLECDPITAYSDPEPKAISFVAKWSKAEQCTAYVVSAYTKQLASGKEQISYLPGWRMANVGDTDQATITGLEPLTTYYYIVYGTDGYCYSDPSNEVEVVTADPTFDFFAPRALEATEVYANQFVANWEPMDGAIQYWVSIYNKELGDSETAVCDFGNGTFTMPAGWGSSTGSAYGNEAYSGAAIPSLRLSSDAQYVQSPVFDADIYKVSFWHRGVHIDEANTLRVEALTDAGTWELVSELPINNAAGGETNTIELPVGSRSVRIALHEEVHKGSVAIDDVAVVWSKEYLKVPIERLTDVTTGTECSYVATGLEALTDYYYTVYATDGEYTSRISNEVKVTTTDIAGIADTSAPAQSSVKLIGSMLVVTCPEGTPVTIMDIAGRKLGQYVGPCRISAPATGAYIVKVGSEAHKIHI